MTQHLINNVKDLKEAVRELTNHSRLSHDTECKGPSGIGGLFPFHGSRSFSHIFATKEDEYYFNFNTGGINPRYKNELQPIFNDTGRVIFYINAMFDATISHFDGLVFKQRIVDCPSIARVEFNLHDGGRYAKDESFLSLEYLADYYSSDENEIKDKNNLVKEYIKEHNLYYEERCRFTGKLLPRYDLVPLEGLMFEYGCDDARSTFDTGQSILRCINYKDQKYQHETKMINVAKNEIGFTSALVEIKINGAKCWVEYTEKAVKHEKEKALRLHQEIDNLTGGINLNSGKQVAEYLIKRGVTVPKNAPTENDKKMRANWLIKKEAFEAQYNSGKLKPKQLETKQRHIDQAQAKADAAVSGRYITDKKTLQKFMKKYPKLDFLSKITEAKAADKKLSTYYLNFLKFKDADDIIHCELNQEKAITGRLSSSNPNFQNLHKEKWDGTDDQFLIRKSIIAKDPDFDLFFPDYKGQEMYIMIDLAEDMAIIKDILENGTDIYIAMGKMVYAFTGIKIDRPQAKALSLGVAYGQGKALIAKNLKCSIDEAMKLKNAFLGSLKGVARLNKRMMRQAERTKKIHNPYGRVSYILDRRFAYKALNSLIQGTAADCTKHAMVDLHQFLKPYRSHMILTVHDEIIFEIHKNERHLLPEITTIMSAAYPHKHLPLKVDVEWSKNSWGEKIEWEGQ